MKTKTDLTTKTGYFTPPCNSVRDRMIWQLMDHYSVWAYEQCRAGKIQYDDACDIEDAYMSKLELMDDERLGYEFSDKIAL